MPIEYIRVGKISVGKTLANGCQFAKLANIFSRHIIALYGKCILFLRVLKLLPTSSKQQPYHHNNLEVNQGVRAVLLLVFAHCLLLSLVTLVPNSRDRHEKMATKFYAPQNMP